MTRVVWVIKMPNASEHLGMLPAIISSFEDRVADQLNNRYAHGGGYHPWGKGEFSLVDVGLNASLQTGEFKELHWTDGVETDDPFKEIARTETRHERVYLFEACILAIVDKVTGELNVTRVD